MYALHGVENGSLALNKSPCVHTSVSRRLRDDRFGSVTNDLARRSARELSTTKLGRLEIIIIKRNYRARSIKKKKKNTMHIIW